MNEILNLELLNAAIRNAAPLIFAALGGLLSERSGVVNIGLEGMMLMGAFVSAWIALLTGSLWLGLFGGVMAGAMLALIHAYATQQWRADHVISGVAVILLASGLTTYLFRRFIIPMEETGQTSVVGVFPSFEAEWMESNPLGLLLKGQNWMVLFALFLPIAIHLIMRRSRWGLRLFAVGNDSQKARSMGVPVRALRYQGVLLSGALAGLAGVFLTLALTGQFRENMSAGKGFIALAALIFGRWTPWGAVGAALGFGFFEALQLQLQGKQVVAHALGADAGCLWCRWLQRLGNKETELLTGHELPTDLLLMLPYLLTVIAMIGLFGKMKPPSDLGNP